MATKQGTKNAGVRCIGDGVASYSRRTGYPALRVVSAK